MVHIKHTAHPISIRVPSEIESMASEEALEAFTAWREASIEFTSLWSLEVSNDCESQSGGSEDTGSASNDSEHAKVVAVAAAAGITFDFGAFGVEKERITLIKNNAHYFPKGYCRPPGVESMSEPRAIEAVVLGDLFTVGLRMLPQSVLADILHKFWVQLHQLTSNAIVQINKFIWAVSSCRGRLTTDVFV
jgi:hypothetical protein